MSQTTSEADGDMPRPPPQAPRREEPAPLKFGMVVFDDEQDPRGGWAAVGGAAAKRIEGLNDLSTDTLWWSNITYKCFFRETSAYVNPWLRHAEYLVVKPKDVLQEWGWDPTESPADFVATFCSGVFGRVMTLAYQLAHECDPKLTMPKFFGGNTLRDDVRPLLPPADFPKAEAAQFLRAGQAYQEFTKTVVRGPRGGRFIMLRRPRVSYTFDMMQTPVPVGQFEHYDRLKLREVASDRVAWVRKSSQPCMAEITVHQMEPDPAAIYGFGNSTDRDRKIARAWVAHPEFMVMSSFSDIEVKNAFVGKEYGLMSVGLNPAIKKFLSDKFTDFSWVAGVVCETLWRASTMGPPRGGGAGKQPPPEDRATTSWRGAWIKAADKAAMFSHAMRLTEMGYAIASYGYGWIMCSVTDDQIPDLIRDALTVGLVPKLVDVPEGLFTEAEAFPWGGDKKAQMFAHLTLTRNKDLLWHLDKLPLFDEAQRNNLLRKMLEQQARKKKR